MPKAKTHKGAAKRFKVTGKGKLKRAKAYHGHILEKKSATRKRRLQRKGNVAAADKKNIKRLLSLD